MFIALYYYVDSSITNDILLRYINRVDPTAMYMSVFLGLYEFGLAGIIYGPLLVLMGSLVYQVFKTFGSKMGQPSNEKA